jgi:signal transduction histidine kinase
MSAECLSRIFDPFFTTKDVGHGMGLGLFIVYQIIEEHGGCISASSTDGQGTTFFIRLPLASGKTGRQDA